MPGIYGIIRKGAPDRQANEDVLRRMQSSLAHYDHYVTQRHVDDWFGVGAISLPGPNEQRLTHISETGITAAHSGYIYGFLDDNRNLLDPAADTAAHLIDLYRTCGRRFPERVNGSFNVALFDSVSQRALIGNDRMGYRQLYYLDMPDLFLFACEVKALLAGLGRPGQISRSGLLEYFNFGYPLGENTLFDQVKFLRGGHLLEIDGDGLKLAQYWDFRYGEESEADLPELIEEAETIYRDVIRRRIRGYDRVIVPLSGGLDSRFIAGHAVQLGVEIHSFTHGRRGCQDHRIATELARALDLTHYSFLEIDPDWLVDHFERFVDLTEGMVEASPAILLGIAEQYDLPVDTTCFLNGIFGGPTNFGTGYFGRQDIARNVTPEEKVRRIAASYGTDEMRQVYYSLFTDDFGAELIAARSESIKHELERHLPVSEWFHNQRDVYLIRNRLTRCMNLVDCNRFGLHDHFALADDRLTDFYIRLPAELKLKRRFLIEYIKTKFPHLARVPYLATGVDLYTEPPVDRWGLQRKLSRTKYYLERLSGGRLRFYDRRVYTHQNQWYRSHKRIRAFYEETLLDRRTIERGYFKPEAIKRLLRYQRRGGNAFYELTWLLTFEVFMRRFIDRA